MSFEHLSTAKKPEFHTENVGAINCLEVEQDQFQFMLSAGADSSIRIYDLDSQVKLDITEDQEFSLAPDYVKTYECIAHIPRQVGHKYGVSCVKWWPFDNGMFISSSFDRTVKVWDSNATAEGEVYKFDLDHRVYSFDISPTGSHSLIAPATEHPLVRLLDLRTTSSAHTLTGHKVGSVLSTKWSPTEPHLLATGGSDGSVLMWDIRRSNACLAALDVSQAVPFQPDDDGYLTQTPIEYRRAHLSAVNSLLWHPDGNYLVTAGCDESIRLWDVHPDNPTRARNTLVNYGPLIRNKYPQALYLSLSCSPDRNDIYDGIKSQYLFFPSDSGQILVFNLFTGALISMLDRPAKRTAIGIPRTTSITARQNNTFEFYSGSLDGNIARWSMGHTNETEEEDSGRSSDSDEYEEDAGNAFADMNL